MTKSKKQFSASRALKPKLKGSFEAIIATAEKNTAKRKEAQENGFKNSIQPF
jgi:hypothetical protein